MKSAFSIRFFAVYFLMGSREVERKEDQPNMTTVILVLLFVRVVDPAVLGRIDLADVSHHFHRLLELAQRASRALAIQQRWRQL